MDINIRLATPADCAHMMQLIQELAVYEKAPEEVTVELEDFENCGFGENSIWTAYVAVWDNQIVGMSLFYPRYSTWKGKKLFLEDLVVTESLRGRNIGQLLFDATLKYAKENDFHSLYWQVLDWNAPAINFYKKYNASFDAEWLNGSITLR